MLCLYFLCSSLEKLFGLTYICPYPQHIAAISRPTMYGRPHVYPLSRCGISMQLMPHLVGQLLSLIVQVWQFASCNNHPSADSVNLCLD